MLYQIIIIVYLVILIPLVDLFAHKKYLQQVEQNQFNRVQFYAATMLELWLPVLAVLALVVFDSLTLGDIGLRPLRFNPYQQNSLMLVVLFICAAIPLLYGLLIVFQYVSLKNNPEFKKAYLDAVKSKLREEGGHFKLTLALLPANAKEKLLWVFVSLTAGICEEVLFRGFLIYFLSVLLPGFPLISLIILQALPFGLIHSYQGISGVIKTTFMGLFFGAYVILFNSILPGIIIHALIDLLGSLMEREQTQSIA